jgi:hypothetical protein
VVSDVLHTQESSQDADAVSRRQTGAGAASGPRGSGVNPAPPVSSRDTGIRSAPLKRYGAVLSGTGNPLQSPGMAPALTGRHECHVASRRQAGSLPPLRGTRGAGVRPPARAAGRRSPTVLQGSRGMRTWEHAGGNREQSSGAGCGRPASRALSEHRHLETLWNAMISNTYVWTRCEKVWERRMRSSIFVCSRSKVPTARLVAPDEDLVRGHARGRCSRGVTTGVTS